MHDHDAFTDETLLHLDQLKRAARRLGRDADDLVQETYLRALQARATFRAGSRAGAWLHRILVNVAISGYRRDARDRRLAGRFSVEPREEIVEPRTPGEELGGALTAALAALPPPQRRVVELADVEGLHYREVARELGCPVGTVMSRLHRARRRLRRAVGERAA